MRNATMKIVISGSMMRFIYRDEVQAVLGCGAGRIVRASHVEPIDGGTTWSADMAPVQGPMLGPFATRQEALDAEVKWLDEHLHEVVFARGA